MILIKQYKQKHISKQHLWQFFSLVNWMLRAWWVHYMYFQNPGWYFVHTWDLTRKNFQWWQNKESLVKSTHLIWFPSLKTYVYMFIAVINVLTHWVRVPHIAVSELISIGSDNGLSLGRRHFLNQCWNIVNWNLRNKRESTFNRNS